MMLTLEARSPCLLCGYRLASWSFPPGIIALADLLAPYTEVRDGHGTMIGCRFLQRVC